MTDTDSLNGRVALISGGASGIGAACAVRLAQAGASIAVTDIDAKLGHGVVERISAAGGRAIFLQHDVTQENQWQSAVARTVAEFGGLNILVNNAGIGIMTSVFDMSLADWQRQQAINLDGVFLGIKHCVPVMKDMPDGGSVINMSSVAGMKGAASLSAYNATKGGVRLFTKGVALECAQNQWPVRVNSVHPGIISTPIWDKINPALEDGMNTADLEQMAQVAVPVSSLGYPEDIANGVLFLASDQSRYITGTELVIDGGMCA